MTIIPGFSLVFPLACNLLYRYGYYSRGAFIYLIPNAILSPTIMDIYRWVVRGRSYASDHRECIAYGDSWWASLSPFALGASGGRSRVTPVFLFFFLHPSQLILLLFLRILKHLLLVLLGFPAHVPRVLPIDRCPLLIIDFHLSHHVFLHLRFTLAVKLFLPFLINLRGMQHIVRLVWHCWICMIHPGFVLSISGVHRHQALGLVAAAVEISLHICVCSSD